MIDELRKEYLALCTQVGNWVFEKADLEARLKIVTDALTEAAKKRLELQKQLETPDVQDPAS